MIALIIVYSIQFRKLGLVFCKVSILFQKYFYKLIFIYTLSIVWNFNVQYRTLHVYLRKQIAKTSGLGVEVQYDKKNQHQLNRITLCNWRVNINLTRVLLMNTLSNTKVVLKTIELSTRISLHNKFQSYHNYFIFVIKFRLTHFFPSIPGD